MKEFKENTDRNELEIHVVGTSASGKSTIQLIIAEALKDKGFNVKINSSDHESEDDFFDTYKNNQELRESSVLKLNDLITINEVQALKTFKTKTKMNKFKKYKKITLPKVDPKKVMQLNEGVNPKKETLVKFWLFVLIFALLGTLVLHLLPIVLKNFMDKL